MNSMIEEIEALKREKNAVILAHYYVPDEVQAIADEVGDSFYLSKKAKESAADVIVFAGVSFMGESACMMNPGKKGTHAGYHSGLCDGAYGFRDSGCRNA